MKEDLENQFRHEKEEIEKEFAEQKQKMKDDTAQALIDIEQGFKNTIEANKKTLIDNQEEM